MFQNMSMARQRIIEAINGLFEESLPELITQIL